MNRNELTYSDNQLLAFIYEGYQIKATQLDFVDIGSFYAFKVTTNEGKNLFLKVYPKDQSLVPIHPTVKDLTNAGIALCRFRDEFAIENLSYMVTNKLGQFCHVTEGLTLILFEHIEGFHPSYTPNQLTADKLAALFFQIHQLPIHEFPYFEVEHFDIQYALGLTEWVDHGFDLKDTTNAHAMFNLLDKNKEQLILGISKIKKWQEQFVKETFPMSITHGDPHHYNVLQTSFDLWLVDWDGIKIAPIERDLWHYQDALLIEEYYKLKTNYAINKELCEFYRLQRFFEDCRYYLEQVLLKKNATELQSEQDKENFINHWGWSICL